jgi:hypothetical protein
MVAEINHLAMDMSSQLDFFFFFFFQRMIENRSGK